MGFVFLGRFVLRFWGDSLLIFGIFTWKLFQRDGIGGIALFLIHDFCIDLSRGHVFMREHFADCVYVGAVGNQKCSVGVAKTVEGNFLLDTGIFEPFLEWFSCMCAAQPFEYHPAARFSAIRQGFIAQR